MPNFDVKRHSAMSNALAPRQKWSGEKENEPQIFLSTQQNFQKSGPTMLDHSTNDIYDSLSNLHAKKQLEYLFKPDFPTIPP